MAFTNIQGSLKQAFASMPNDIEAEVERLRVLEAKAQKAREIERTAAARRDMARMLGLDPQHTHLTTMECYENGCRTCEILPPPSAKPLPPAQQGPAYNAQASAMAQQQFAAQQSVNAQAQLGLTAWPPNVNSKPAEPARGTLVVDGTITPYGYVPTPPATVTVSDAIGQKARASTLDAIAGCRLGCGCKQHSKAKPAPWVPSVDDFDLLPDA